MPSFQGLLDHPLSRMMTESFVACIDAPPVPPRTDDRARRAGARPHRRLHRRALSRQPRRARRRAAVAAPRPPEHDGARGGERRAPGARAARPCGGPRRRRARGCRHRVPGTVPGAGRGFDGRHDRLECLFAGLNVARCRPRATCPREGRERGPSNHSTCDVTPSGKHLPPEPAQARTLARHTSASGILGPRFRGDDPCPTLRPDMTAPRDFLVRPDPHDPRLTEAVTGVDQTGQPIATRVTVERPLTIFLNSQEIVTAMTINDYPEYLALGYLLNQHMLLPDDVVSGVDYDEELSLVVVRTKRKTNYEKKLKKKVQTSSCAPPGFMRSRTRSTPRPRSILRPARSTAACWRARTSR